MRDQSKLIELNERMFQLMHNGEDLNLGIVAPNFNVDLSAVRYKFRWDGGSNPTVAVSKAQMLHYAQNSQTYDEFAAIQIEAFDLNGKKLAQRSILDCISLIDDSEASWIYCLDYREWYRMSSDYATRLNNAVDHKWIAPATLMPDFDRALDEGKYNAKVPGTDGFKSYVCLDKKLIPMGTDGTGTEACDIITDKAHLISVKRGTGFGEISYVCSQALVSAQSFDESPSFREALKKQIGTSNLIDEAHKDHGFATFVIGIVADRHRNLPIDMSFNCKLTLEQTLRNIENLGFNAKILHIRYA